MHSVGRPMINISDTRHTYQCSYEEVSKDAVDHRLNLQKSVINHVGSILDEINQRLGEMESAINLKLSPIHLRRLIDYIKEDLQPLKGYVLRISNHGQHIGSLQKELATKKWRQFESPSTSDSDRISRSSSSLPRFGSTYFSRHGSRRNHSPKYRKLSHAESFHSLATAPSRLWTPTCFQKKTQVRENLQSSTKSTTATRRQNNNKLSSKQIKTFTDFKTNNLDTTNSSEYDSSCQLSSLLPGANTRSCEKGNPSSSLITDTTSETSTRISSLVGSASQLCWSLRSKLSHFENRVRGECFVKLCSVVYVLLILLLINLSLQWWLRGWWGQWWRRICYRLGVVYKLYTGRENCNLPIM